MQFVVTEAAREELFEPAHGSLLRFCDREYAANAGEHLFKT
jgi:hypothetical protein